MQVILTEEEWCDLKAGSNERIREKYRAVINKLNDDTRRVLIQDSWAGHHRPMVPLSWVQDALRQIEEVVIPKC